jgi:EAL domain-containing protein (putative c-di-GMP-specific phosphodiesterase class I)
MTNANRLLVLDDHPDLQEFIAQAAEGLGYDVQRTGSEPELRACYAQFEPTVIVLDLRLPDCDGIEVLRWLGRQRCKAAVIVASGMDRRVLCSAEDLGRTFGLKMAGAAQKPIRLDTLEALLSPLRVKTRRYLDMDVARALDRGQLRVHYQPKIRRSPGGWSVVAIEALLRWEHPEHGLVYPDDFIGIAERHGLIGALTDFVLQTGIEQIGQWNGLGLELNLSVNLSPKLVTDVDFPDRLDQLLDQLGVQGEQLTIEVTETAALSQPERTLDILTRLRVKQIGLSLDDFGTGYSSLTQLYKMPFNEIKIDKSLGMDLPQTPEAKSIVHAIIELGHNLGMQVCCEGVENELALEFLHEVNCDFAQGYCIARPMAADSIPAWVRGWQQRNQPVAASLSKLA